MPACRVEKNYIHTNRLSQPRPRRHLLPPPLPRRYLPARALKDRTRKKLPPNLIRQRQHPRADRSAVSPVFTAVVVSRKKKNRNLKPRADFAPVGSRVFSIPFSPRQRNRLDKVPQLTSRDNVTCFGIASRRPCGGEFDGGGFLGLFAFREHDNAFFFEELEGVLEGFFVDGFEVGEVALVV